jgi:phasin
MDMTRTTARPTSSAKADASRAFSEMAEKGATQARETFENMGSATTQAADVIKASSSTALKGMQDFNNKFLEFAHTNTNAAFDFVQRLQGVKSPSEFMELSTEHTRNQIQAVTEQTKQLVEHAQKAVLATAEPLKMGVTKAFNHVA